MLEGLGLQSNSVYPLIASDNSEAAAGIITRSPSKLGPMVQNNVQNFPVFSYSKAAKLRNSGNIKILKSNLKKLIATIYVNYFRPNYVHTSVISNFRSNMLSAFSLKFSQDGEYFV